MTLEITKKEVEKLIKIRENDTVKNHFLTVISRDFQAKGEITSNKIKFWKQGFWNMSTYPIFIFEFNSENHLINITDKINPIGKIFNLIILIPIIFLIVIQFINGSNLIDNWLPFTLFGIILLLLILIVQKVYNFEKQNQLEKIYALLDIETEEKNAEKEWSYKKIITRIFMYPFCIGLILLAIFLLFPDGKIIYAIACLAIAGAYLFSDIKILIGKKTTANNGYK
ncbi:hypothetical protein KFZ70_15165 [Tamlana fucoidanivorans]|uniref:hypothetical protein n=1 Tax=Allotamlana fucoidanivorans TaxID=2583814 RepID=UPI0038912EB6